MKQSSTSPMRGALAVAGAVVLLGTSGSLLAAPNDHSDGHPPQFTTIPMHDRMIGVEVQNGHVVFRPPLTEDVGGGEAPPSGQAPGGGHGGGGGGNVNDYGDPAGVAVAPNCFPNSTNNFDATCAQDSYQGEPMLNADPVDGVLVGAENDIYPGNCSTSAATGTFGDCGLSTAVSADGSSWQRFKLSRTYGGHTFVLSFDPSVAVDSHGQIFAAFGMSDSGNRAANGIAAATSTDGGNTWTKTNAITLNLKGRVFDDKYWMAADDNVGSAFQDRLYVAWDRNDGNNQILFVSHSADQGQTWSSPLKINDGTSNFERVIGAFPAVAPDGTVYVLWHDYAADTLFIDKSTDGGASFGSDVAVANTHTGFGVDIGCNGGRSMSPAASMAIDPSGSIYVAYADSVQGGGFDVFLVKSTDGGATWSAPKRVSATSAGEQYNPGVAYNASKGEVEVTYLDRRDDPADCRTNTYLSSSTDNGATFTDTRVTDVGSVFDGNPNGPGDYGTVTALSGTTYPYFADHRDANAAVDDNAGTTDGGFEIYSGVQP